MIGDFRGWVLRGYPASYPETTMLESQEPGGRFLETQRFLRTMLKELRLLDD